MSNKTLSLHASPTYPTFLHDAHQPTTPSPALTFSPSDRHPCSTPPSINTYFRQRSAPLSALPTTPFSSQYHDNKISEALSSNPRRSPSPTLSTFVTPNLKETKIEPVVVAEVGYDITHGYLCEMESRERIGELIADYGEAAVEVLVPYLIRIVGLEEGRVGEKETARLEVVTSSGILTKAEEGCESQYDGEEWWMDVVYWMMPVAVGEAGEALMVLKVGNVECDIVVRATGVEPKVTVMCERMLNVGGGEDERLYEKVAGSEGAVFFPSGYNFGQCEVVVRNDMSSTAPLLVQARLSDDCGGAFSLAPDLTEVPQQGNGSDLWSGISGKGMPITHSCFVVVGRAEEAVFVVGFELPNGEPRPDYYCGHLDVTLVGIREFSRTYLPMAKLTHWVISLEAASGPEAREEAWKRFAGKDLIFKGGRRDENHRLMTNEKNAGFERGSGDDMKEKENQHSNFQNNAQPEMYILRRKDISKTPAKSSAKRARSVARCKQHILCEANSPNTKPEKEAAINSGSVCKNITDPHSPSENEEKGDNKNLLKPAGLPLPKLHFPGWLRRAQMIELPSNQKPVHVRLRNVTPTTIHVRAKMTRHAPEEDQCVLFEQESNRCHDVSCTPATSELPSNAILKLTLQQRQNFERQSILLVECTSERGRKLYGFPVRCGQQEDMTLLYDQ